MSICDILFLLLILQFVQLFYSDYIAVNVMLPPAARRGSRTVGPDNERCLRCVCGKFYSRMASLKFHLRYECGKEPKFGCPYCSRKCKRRSNLISHIRIVHKDFSYQLNQVYWYALCSWNGKHVLKYFALPHIF